MHAQCTQKIQRVKEINVGEQVSFLFFPSTFQILMKDLDPDFMALFSTAAYSSSKHLIADLGLDELVDGAIIDAKIFEPCGFSLNAINKVCS